MSEEERLIRRFPKPFLRAMDPSNYDKVTHQRKDFQFDQFNGKPLEKYEPPKLRNFKIEKDNFQLYWEDGTVSQYTREWLDEQMVNWRGLDEVFDERMLWSDVDEHYIREGTEMNVEFKELLTEEGQDSAIRILYGYGILLVKNTPIDDDGAGVAALASALGGGSVKNSNTLIEAYQKGKAKRLSLPKGTDGPMRTLYGTVWSTAKSKQKRGTSTADSAYGCGSLPLHTDMTYLRDPPGLQIFTMVQPSKVGGESIFADGFAVANELRESNPDAYNLLKTTVRRYRCVDDSTGWHLEASGPIISENYMGICNMIRHNDLDRLPDFPPRDARLQIDFDQYYDKLWSAHRAWNNILSTATVRLEMALGPGETIVLANQVRESG
jgi:hypothetical protein